MDLKQFIGKTIKDLDDNHGSADLVIVFDNDQKLYLYAVDNTDSAELVISDEPVNWC